MKNHRRLVFITIFALLLLTLPTTALANKKIYLAKLTTGAELHEVVGSKAWGSFALVTNLDGTLGFQMQVVNLSGAPTGVHLHAPATASENAPVIVTLCGAPAPSAAGACPFDSSTNSMTLSGKLTSSLMAQWGVTGQQLMQWLDDELVYVNLHTALNPAGEVRGQLHPR